MSEKKPGKKIRTADKRKFPRLAAKYLVSYEYYDDEYTEDVEGMGISQNLSLGGIRVEIDKHVRAGALLFMEIGLRDHVLKATGKIVHSRPLTGDRVEVGVAFTEISAQALDLLSSFFLEKGLGPDKNTTSVS